jgi:hypothetical protein
MYLIHTVAIVISGKFSGAVGDGGMLTARICYPIVSLCFIGINLATCFGLGFNLRLNLVDSCTQTNR